ncbi:MAG: NADH-quinone oxidoreductase subunit E [Rhodobacterales bacterium]|nr:NADH-quinone oxidoreductase subunit E [Rhodobacterales bacterium]
MLRRLHPEQPETFAFLPANQKWAEAQITKYPEGRQASAVIPLLWRAQEQERWLTRPAIEHIADMLGMAYIRVLEVASFYFMFQLQPVGEIANIQVCGTTSCMICGAEDLIGVCREKIADKPHTLSTDGNFSWEEVECLGACSNAPMAQIGKDYYEDLTAKRLGEIIDELAAGKVPVPGPQNGRYAAEPLNGLTSLTEYDSGKTQYNASAQMAVDIGDSVKRIDGTEVPILTPWLGKAFGKAAKPAKKVAAAKPAKAKPAKEEAAKPVEKPAKAAKKVVKTAVKSDVVADAGADTGAGKKPKTRKAARKGGADNLKTIKGIGPKLEAMLHEMGFFHFDQVASWGADEVSWVDQNLTGFKGRVSRDNWVDQAATLARGEETEFSARVKKGKVY